MAPFHVRTKVCIAPMNVRSIFVDFAPHMEGNHADFAPHIDWRHSFKDRKIEQIEISVNFLKEVV